MEGLLGYLGRDALFFHQMTMWTCTFTQAGIIYCCPACFRRLCRNESEWIPAFQASFLCVCVSQIPSAIWWNLSLCSRNSVLSAWSKTHRKKYIEMHWPNDRKSYPLSSSPSLLSCVRAELSGRFISSHHIQVFVSVIFFFGSTVALTCLVMGAHLQFSTVGGIVAMCCYLPLQVKTRMRVAGDR